ncbi:diacylglycerol/lipid kinase family protein [Devosia riboflavina]|uniref:diacylglycerol/lipid kinase family protein n=1 Tax=Devosia riboflavina TaxID=46914 RepID=UPI00068EC0EB|nr:diacylglycerol kinase family protein [Devosia riboflavina]
MQQTAPHRFHIILNANSGTVLATGISVEALEALCAETGLDAEVDGDVETPLMQRVERAVEAGAEVIVAAGGDGTITALAGALAGTDRVLGILPLGTVNALAKDLGIPLEVKAAIAALATGVTRQIDVGEVNERVFLHKVVIGVIPSLAAAREHIRGQGTWSSKFAFMRFLLHRLSRARRMAVAINPEDGPEHIVRAKAVAVACNEYEEGLGKVFSRSELDGGRLTIYTLSSLTVGDFVRLASGMVLGTWRDAPALSIESSRAVIIRSRKKLLKVMFDGEVETLHSPLRFKIRPQALTVLVPAGTGDNAQGGAA